MLWATKPNLVMRCMFPLVRLKGIFKTEVGRRLPHRPLPNIESPIKSVYASTWIHGVSGGAPLSRRISFARFATRSPFGEICDLVDCLDLTKKNHMRSTQNHDHTSSTKKKMIWNNIWVSYIYIYIYIWTTLIAHKMQFGGTREGA